MDKFGLLVEKKDATGYSVQYAYEHGFDIEIFARALNTAFDNIAAENNSSPVSLKEGFLAYYLMETNLDEVMDLVQDYLNKRSEQWGIKQ